jgi:hypothetical protein
MLLFSRFLWIYSIAVFTIFLFPIGVKMESSHVSQRAETSSGAQRISLIIWTDRGKYSLGDSVRVNAALQNNGGEPVYVDRRMFFTGYGGGLELDMEDANGKPITARPFSHAIMPPPQIDDLSILIPLDVGFLYGTSVGLRVKDFFPKPGKYSIRVNYKSMISKEFVAPQLRNLPALWEDTPEIDSDTVWIEIIQ